MSFQAQIETLHFVQGDILGLSICHSRLCQYLKYLGGYRERERFEVTCAECGQKTTVPFKPVLDKPVYCNACYAKVKQSR
ncbi:MAG: hypothetical protein HY762_04755 [Planctomycetes bacterium]|nr:hypothetical protein [Planctomycetota bacterium]